MADKKTNELISKEQVLQQLLKDIQRQEANSIPSEYYDPESVMGKTEEEEEALRLQAGIEPLSERKRVGPLRLSDMVGGANRRFKNLKDVLYKKLMSQPEEQPSDSKKK